MVGGVGEMVGGGGGEGGRRKKRENRSTVSTSVSKSRLQCRFYKGLPSRRSPQTHRNDTPATLSKQTHRNERCPISALKRRTVSFKERIAENDHNFL